MLHRRGGHSEKVTGLSDFEFRVWTAYLLAADDFGIMRANAVTLQAADDSLAGRPATKVKHGLDRLVEAELVRTFEHQGQGYVYQHNWQEWQKVKFPRKTLNPCPPTPALAECCPLTRALFGEWFPGGKKPDRKESANTPQSFSDNSEKSPKTISEDSENYLPSRARAPKTANGLRLQGESEGDAGLAYQQWREAWEKSGRKALPLGCSPKDGQNCIAFAVRYPDADWRAEILRAFFASDDPQVRKSPPSLGWFVSTWMDETDMILRQVGRRPKSEAAPA